MPSNIEVQIEKVVPVLPKLMRTAGTTLFDKIKGVPVEKVGEKNFRIPAHTTNGWTGGNYDPNGGPNIRGSAPSFNEMTGTFIDLSMAAELTRKNMFVNDGNKDKSLVDVFKISMAAMPEEWANFMESMLYSNGTPYCVTGTAHSVVGGVSVYTGDANSGVRRLRRGCPVTVFDTTGATIKATTYATKVEYETKQVTLAVSVAGAAASDIIAYGHWTAGSPTGIYGLKYWNDNASSGTTLGINRANEYEIRASGINVAGALTQDAALLLIDRMNVRMGMDSIAGMNWMGIIAPAQRARIIAGITTSIQRIDVTSGTNGTVDLLPKVANQGEFTWAGGIRHKYAINQDSDRVDYFTFEKLRKAEADEFGFIEMDGRKIFPVYSTSNGIPTNAIWYGVKHSLQIFSVEPRTGGYLYGLTKPTGYDAF